MKATSRQRKLIKFVKRHHDGQVRKYTGEPYFNHVLAVAKSASRAEVLNGFEVGLCHDLIEDTQCGAMDLYSALLKFEYSKEDAEFIVESVVDLTDIYTPAAFPDLNRAARKKLESKRLWKVAPHSQTVKYCDLMDNTPTIVKYAKKFAVKYIGEALFMLEGMNNGDQLLYNKCLSSVLYAKEYLKEYELV